MEVVVVVEKEDCRTETVVVVVVVEMDCRKDLIEQVADNFEMSFRLASSKIPLLMMAFDLWQTMTEKTNCLHLTIVRSFFSAFCELPFQYFC
jgi:hypothetical protein